MSQEKKQRVFIVKEKLHIVRDAFVMATSKKDAVARARDGEAYDWSELDVDHTKTRILGAREYRDE
jgi:hypothetical protein